MIYMKVPKMNNFLYEKLYHIYSSVDVNGEKVENPRSVHDIERRAMVLKRTTRLTASEKEACQEIWREFQKEV